MMLKVSEATKTGFRDTNRISYKGPKQALEGGELLLGSLSIHAENDWQFIQENAAKTTWKRIPE